MGHKKKSDKSFVYSLDEISRVVKYLKQKFNKCKIFAFYGPLGVGKTTLIRALLQNCGISSHITSPTFTYLNIYKNDQGQKFYHFDLYRLTELNDFLEAGFGEYLDDPKCICLIEWPEILEPLLKSEVCKVILDYEPEGKKRLLTCETRNLK